ncbi:hypothetical protein DPX16_10400 [Anabarilius grahami]|uniref:Uncharacterized protein n=1 Tax=Anabarilius grahami TaxID=495550 RepID=A0A3N0Y665_ANAGA|nr:hypothetical protein DPX16_10400 [Anabarilius grahami]
MQELGEWAGTPEEEGLRMGPEQPDGTGSEGVGSKVGPREGTGSMDHRSIRQWSTPGSGMDWEACTNCGMSQVAGSRSATDMEAGSKSALSQLGPLTEASVKENSEGEVRIVGLTCHI